MSNYEAKGYLYVKGIVDIRLGVILSCFSTKVFKSHCGSTTIIASFLQILTSVVQLISTSVVKFVQTRKGNTPAAVTWGSLSMETSVLVCIYLSPAKQD